MNGSAPLNVVCVLKSGGEYDAEYVERLRDGVSSHLRDPHAFICITDTDVPCRRIELTQGFPGWWSKLELFRPDIDGDILYFDLDTLIVGDITNISRHRGLTLLSDFYHLDHVASGMMFLPWFERGSIWKEWIKDPAGHMNRLGGRGDQGFLQEFWDDKAYRWQSLFPGQVVSYKAHVRKAENIRESGDGTVPEDARVVCFHGRPRPREVQWSI